MYIHFSRIYDILFTQNSSIHHLIRYIYNSKEPGTAKSVVGDPIALVTSVYENSEDEVFDWAFDIVKDKQKKVRKGGRVFTWAFELMKEQVREEVVELSKPAAGLHFNASQASPELLKKREPETVLDNNLPEITVAYESGWNKFTEKFYAKTEWPEAELIAPLVNDDNRMSDKMEVDPPTDEQPSGASTPIPDSQPTVGDQDVERDAEAPLSSSSTTDPIQDDTPAPPRRPNNWERREIARTTIETIDYGSFEVEGQVYDLQPTTEALIEGTVYYPPDSAELDEWSKEPTVDNGEKPGLDTDISIVQCSTLEGCHQLHSTLAALEGERDRRIGVLNFASAKKPGGGFLTGAQAQEETIARSSTLYASLMINTAQQFYRLHHEGPKDGYYTHAMIYSPHVQLFRHDSGEWHAPIGVEVLTSPAVNAGDVRRKSRRYYDNDEDDDEDEDGPEEEVERKIEAVMKERMGRLLYLFEKRGVKNLILGSFGTGVFQNSVEVVAKLWIELFVKEDGRFKRSFERVVFAIIDTPTVTAFREAFSGKGDKEQLEEWEVVSRDEGTVGEVQESESRAGEDAPDAEKGGPRL